MAGTTPATFGHRLATSGQALTVEEFYGAELSRRGWASSTSISGARRKAELRARIWEKDGVLFRLGIERDGGIQNDEAARLLSTVVTGDYSTVYTVELIEAR